LTSSNLLAPTIEALPAQADPAVKSGAAAVENP
jgi:hypothetical protein